MTRGIALVDYFFQVPANHLAYRELGGRLFHFKNAANEGHKNIH